MSARRRIWLGLSVAFSVAAVVLVGRWLDWEGAYGLLVAAEPAWLLAALVAFIANYWLRTWRIRWLLAQESMPFLRLLGVTSLYGMFNYLMPAKSGEISFLYLVRRHVGVAVSQGAAGLIIARFFDLATLALFLPAAVFAFHDRLPSWLVGASAAYCALVGAAGLVLARLVNGTRTGPPPARPPAVVGWGQRLAGAVRALLEGLRAIHRRGQYARLWLVTAGIWGCIYANLYAIVASLGYEPDLLELVVLSMFLVPMTLLPVQGLANVGTHEAAWIAAFAIFGYPMSESLSIAVTSHVVLFVLVVALDAVGSLLLATGPVAVAAVSGSGPAPPTRGPA